MIQLGFLAHTEARIELILSRTGLHLISELSCELNLGGRARRLRRKRAPGLVVTVMVRTPIALARICEDVTQRVSKGMFVLQR